MKYREPSEFFKFIIEKAGLDVINDTQRSLAFALDLLDSQKSYFHLLKIAFIFDAYKELIKAYDKDSKAKKLYITKSIKILTDDCFTKDDNAYWAIGWLANVIYPNEWKNIISKINVNIDEIDKKFLKQAKIPVKKVYKEEFTDYDFNAKTISNFNFNSISESIEAITFDDNTKFSTNNLLKKNWTLNDINLKMILCPAGTFIMGSPVNELGRNTSETTHQVIITKPFMIGKYPITQKQYFSIIGSNPSYFNGYNNPVESVSWFEAKKFCEILNAKYKNSLPKGYIFSLPTEAQWEYACRAGSLTALNNGRNLTSDYGICSNLHRVAWYSLNSNNSTHPVGQRIPNHWGIYDMLGNVWEWCEDWYGEYYNNIEKDPIGTLKSTRRVNRGGSWVDYPMNCRSARRRGFGPTKRDIILGFRVALVSIDNSSQSDDW